MQTSYHFSSAQEISNDMIEAIKARFKSKAITIIVEDNDFEVELPNDMKVILDDRLQEDEATYISAAESIERLNKKYGL